jgi:hypothetical protein
VGGIFCDLAKSFDCVSHDTVLPKLNFYGKAGKGHERIKSYPRKRHQRVEIIKISIVIHFQSGET